MNNACYTLTPDDVAEIAVTLSEYFLSLALALMLLKWIISRFILNDQEEHELFIDRIIDRMDGWYRDQNQKWLDAGYEEKNNDK